MSVGLTVADATRMRTSPRPGCGTGSSDTSSTSGPPNREKVTARISGLFWQPPWGRLGMLISNAELTPPARVGGERFIPPGLESDRAGISQRHGPDADPPGHAVFAHSDVRPPGRGRASSADDHGEIGRASCRERV